MSAAERHIPVLVDRVLALLAPALDRPDAILVDGTLGLAGHASALLAGHPGLHLIGIDRDPSALERSRARLEPYAGRVTLVHAVYDEIPEVLAAHARDTRGRGEADGVLLDLGVSSPQLDEGERGFAYSYDAPLDMRMDTTQELTAAEVVNDYSERELTRILRTYGEERNAGRVAKAIVRERARTPITSTARLAEIVRDAIPAPAKRTGGNPAKRTFQGLRIEVNGELEVLERAVPAAIGALALDGRMAVLSYHSLEDRLVKRAFAERSTDTTPHGLPVSLPDRLPELSLLTRGAERPDDEEIRDNPRAASARLRAVRRVRTGGGGA